MSIWTTTSATGRPLIVKEPTLENPSKTSACLSSWMMWVSGATTWMAAARLARGEILTLRERDFVHAARSAGAPSWRVALIHLLPGALAPLIVEGTLRVGSTVLLEAALSFLGLGAPPPTASWGSLVADGRDRLLDAWWISTFPGLAIAATVVALSLLGDALRERFDPRSKAA